MHLPSKSFALALLPVTPRIPVPVPARVLTPYPHARTRTPVVSRGSVSRGQKRGTHIPPPRPRRRPRAARVLDEGDKEASSALTPLAHRPAAALAHPPPLFTLAQWGKKAHHILLRSTRVLPPPPLDAPLRHPNPRRTHSARLRGFLGA
ncbi:hypothetical protein DFH06DRAFT_1486012 [Mycena polygramma]|nr:hypothetical protein DFH06DRAFT_1486012 [Mycena polygramma]